MPTIPLISQPPDPDAWHEVRAPGGYEWWYVDADDERHDRHLVAALYAGSPFHVPYLRRYARYRRRPTRVAPPLPEDFPCAQVALYEGGALRWRRTMQFPAQSFGAAADAADAEEVAPLILGPNRLSRIDRRLELELRFEGTDRSEPFRATLALTPRFAHAPVEQELFTRALPAAAHRWIVGPALHDVHGAIHIGSSELTLRGVGYRDHHFGTGPLAFGLKRWLRGRVLLDDAAYAFHVSRSLDATSPDEARLIEASPDATRAIPVSRPRWEESRRTGRRLDYPDTVALDDVVQLHNPRVIGSSGFQLRVKYDAWCRGRGGTAVCEIVYPQRLSLPIFGRAVANAPRQSRPR